MYLYLFVFIFIYVCIYVCIYIYICMYVRNIFLCKLYSNQMSSRINHGNGSRCSNMFHGPTGCAQPTSVRRDATRRACMCWKRVARELRKRFTVSSDRLVNICIYITCILYAYTCMLKSEIIVIYIYIYM